MLSDSTHLELTTTGAKQHVRFSNGGIEFDLVAYGLLARSELAQKLTRQATLRFGYDVLLGPYTTTGRLPEDPGAGAPDIGPATAVPAKQIQQSDFFALPAVYAEMDMHPSR